MAIRVAMFSNVGFFCSCSRAFSPLEYNVSRRVSPLLKVIGAYRESETGNLNLQHQTVKMKAVEDSLVQFSGKAVGHSVKIKLSTNIFIRRVSFV